MTTRTQLVRRAFGTVVFAAFSFGAGQAFAAADHVREWDACDPWYYDQALSCQESCVETYGPGTQSTCSMANGYPYPVCQCIR